MLSAHKFTLLMITVACLVGASIHAEEATDESGSSHPTERKAASTLHGRATWYGEELHGHKTASGKPFDMNKLTAAHHTLPFGTKLLVKNARTGKSCLVEINDRCPPRSDRVIDVSKEAARQLGILPAGHARVECIVMPSNTNL